MINQENSQEMQIAIAGAAGRLGTALQKIFPNALLLDKNCPNPTIEYVDITSIDSLRGKLKNLGHGDWVINAVAYVDVNLAETEQGRSDSLNINVIGPNNLASLSFEQLFRVIHISTAYVFDGIHGHYKESDEPTPLNTYGLHKWFSENIILEVGGVVLRTDGLYGKDLNGKRNFVDDIVRQAKETEILEVISDQIGSPTYTKDLAMMIEALLPKLSKEGTERAPFRGEVYHAVNQGRVSRADLAREIINILGLTCEVHDITTFTYNGRRAGQITAIRPRDCSLDTGKLKNLGIVPRPWQTALNDYLHS